METDYSKSVRVDNNAKVPTCVRCGHEITRFVEEHYVFEGNFCQVVNVAGKIGNQITYQKQFVHTCPDPEIIHWWEQPEDWTEEKV